MSLPRRHALAFFGATGDPVCKRIVPALHALTAPGAARALCGGHV